MKDALLRGDIQGVLLDAYTAGSNRNAFHHPQLRALSMIKYPRTYGVVLSGALAHVSNEARDYVQTNQQRILEILQRSTEAMEVSCIRWRILEEFANTMEEGVFKMFINQLQYK